MSAAITPLGPPLQAGSFLFCLGKLVFSGNYATNGDAFDPATAFPTGTTNQPVAVFFDPPDPAGFLLERDAANKKVKVNCNTAGGANGALGEHTAAALPAGLTAATIYFMAIFKQA